MIEPTRKPLIVAYNALITMGRDNNQQISHAAMQESNEAVQEVFISVLRRTHGKA